MSTKVSNFGFWQIPRHHAEKRRFCKILDISIRHFFSKNVYLLSNEMSTSIFRVVMRKIAILHRPVDGVLSTVICQEFFEENF